MYETKQFGVSTSGSLGYGGTIDLPKQAEEVPRVSREMGTIQKLIAENRETLAMLESRLSAVLRPIGPRGEDKIGGTVPRDATSPLMSDLEGFNSSLQMLLAHQSEILNRVEI